MADGKLTDQTELDATPTTGDIIYIVDDPGGTPVNKKVQLANLLSNAGTLGFVAQTATGDGTTTIYWTAGNKFHFTFGAFNETFTFSPEPGDPCNLILWMKQDATGGRIVTSWPADVKWPGGTAPTLSTAGSAIDIISFYYDGTDFYGVQSLNFS